MRTSPFYVTLTPKLETQFLEWIQSWREALLEEEKNNNNDYEQLMQRMRLANPKCTLRECMLSVACKALQTNNDDAKF